MSIEILPLELILEITNYLTNKGKLNFILCSKKLYDYRYSLKFNDEVTLNKILNSDLIFTNVIANLNEKIPDNVTHLTIGWHFHNTS